MTTRTFSRPFDLALLVVDSIGTALERPVSRGAVISTVVLGAPELFVLVWLCIEWIVLVVR